MCARCASLAPCEVRPWVVNPFVAFVVRYIVCAPQSSINYGGSISLSLGLCCWLSLVYICLLSPSIIILTPSISITTKKGAGSARLGRAGAKRGADQGHAGEPPGGRPRRPALPAPARGGAQGRRLVGSCVRPKKPCGLCQVPELHSVTICGLPERNLRILPSQSLVCQNNLQV